MKSTGIVRKVDDLGRLVIPIELRRKLGVKIKDPLEIFVEEERIILQRYKPSKACVITGEVKPENRVYADGAIVLSPEGAKIIKDELQKQL